MCVLGVEGSEKNVPPPRIISGTVLKPTPLGPKMRGGGEFHFESGSQCATAAVAAGTVPVEFRVGPAQQ